MNKRPLIREADEYSLEDAILILKIVCTYVNKEREFNSFHASPARSSGLYRQLIDELDYTLTTGKLLGEEEENK